MIVLKKHGIFKNNPKIFEAFKGTVSVIKFLMTLLKRGECPIHFGTLKNLN